MLDHHRYLELALAQAEIALAEGSTPVGGVLVDADGEVVAVSRNQSAPLGDPTAHAEMQAIRAGGVALMPRSLVPAPGARDYTLYTTGEPCLMCVGLVLLSPIDTLVWAAGPIVLGGSAWDAIAGSGWNAGALREDHRHPRAGRRDPPPEPRSCCTTSSRRAETTRARRSSTTPRPARPMLRIGVLTPSSNTVLEPETARLAGADRRRGLLPRRSFPGDGHLRRRSAPTRNSPSAPMLAAVDLLADADDGRVPVERHVRVMGGDRDGQPARGGDLGANRQAGDDLDAGASGRVRGARGASLCARRAVHRDDRRDRIVANLAARGFACVAIERDELTTNCDFAGVEADGDRPARATFGRDGLDDGRPRRCRRHPLHQLPRRSGRPASWSASWASRSSTRWSSACGASCASSTWRFPRPDSGRSRGSGRLSSTPALAAAR